MKTDQKVAQPAPSPQAGEVVFPVEQAGLEEKSVERGSACLCNWVCSVSCRLSALCLHALHVMEEGASQQLSSPLLLSLDSLLSFAANDSLGFMSSLPPQRSRVVLDKLVTFLILSFSICEMGNLLHTRWNNITKHAPHETEHFINT